MKVYVNGKEKTLKEGATLKDAVAGEKYVEGSTVSIYLSTEKVTEVTNDFAIVTSQGEMVLHLYDTPEAKASAEETMARMKRDNVAVGGKEVL